MSIFPCLEKENSISSTTKKIYVPSEFITPLISWHLSKVACTSMLSPLFLPQIPPRCAFFRERKSARDGERERGNLGDGSDFEKFVEHENSRKNGDSPNFSLFHTTKVWYYARGPHSGYPTPNCHVLTFSYCQPTAL